VVDLMSRFWWAVEMRGLAAVVFGLITLISPSVTLSILVVLFGAYALVDGVVALAGAIGSGGSNSIGERRGWLVLEGIVGIATGVGTLVWPNITTTVLVSLVAVWTILTGVLEIATAVKLRRELANEWLMALSGALSIVFGGYLIVSPAQGALALVTVIGIYALVFGVMLCVFALRLRRYRRRLASAPGLHGQTVPAR
jgi:uncharacterized membrane protein HdeD (DUF308 family)